MSLDELKIRKELELEIEKNLEEEILEGIHSLAMRLHGLYQHSRETLSHHQNKQTKSRKVFFSEININIKIEDAGVTVRVKKIKKPGLPGLPIHTRKVQNVRGKTTKLPSSRTTKFDWTQSLRSSTNIGAGSKIEGKNRDDVRAWK